MGEIEIWTPIEGFEKFELSNLGKVKNTNWHNTGKVVITEGSPDSKDYNIFTTWKGEKRKTFRIHRLVGEYYLPNPLNLPEINHKIEGPEGKKMNRVIFNEDMSINYDLTTIEWCDRNYNNNYGTRNERAGKTNTNGKKSKPVLQFTLDGEFVREWPSIHEVGRNGFAQGNVSACCRGEYKTAYGYVWRYKGLIYEEEINYKTPSQRTAEARSKPLLQYTLDGEFVCEWASTRECGRNGFDQSAVSACCRGKRKSYKGYIWKYKERTT